jgi:photosystem II stability/assembly factor-like uncharacterized protein
LAGGPPAGLASGAPTDPVTANLILFAGTSEGPWRSRDWGATWEPIERISGGDDPGAIGATYAFHPIGPIVLMAGEGGLFVSRDFGDTWKRHRLGEPLRSVVASRYWQADPTLFLGTASGLLKSEDMGSSARPTTLRGTPVLGVFWPGPALVLATGRGVVRSDDGGASFVGPGEGLPEGEVLALGLSSYFAVDPVLFASVGSEGVYHSTDGGQTWSPAGLAGRTITDLRWMGPMLYAVAEDGLYRSDSLGQDWDRIDQNLGAVRPRRLLFPLAPESAAVVFLISDAAVHRSSDGGHGWQRLGSVEGDPLCLATFPSAGTGAADSE